MAETKRTFTIETPSSSFPVNFYFNQFEVDHPDEGGVVISFGCVHKGRVLDEVFSVAFPKETFDLTREDTINYLGRVGEIMPMEKSVVRPSNRIISANLIGMSYRGDTAETLLHNFVFRLTLLDAKETTFTADPVALLRSPLNVQRHLIRALYSQ